MIQGVQTDSSSQTVKAQIALRELLLSGAFAPGERLTELAMVDRLGVSRTPVRAAMMRLAEEGLLDEQASGGYVVRAFSERDAIDAIEIRGSLEGLAARLAAERGVTPMQLAPLRLCLDEIDEVIEDAATSITAFSQYVSLNARFHAELMALADSRTLERQIERVIALPFASPSAFIMMQSAVPHARLILTVAQDQHRVVTQAIAAREGARAESLMREHARLAIRNLNYALSDESAMGNLPGAGLILSAGR
jgi:GntR family transcriptional regulator, vanillate catabolism transcriptional regulator